MATISVTVTRSDSFAVEFTEDDIAEIVDTVECGESVGDAIRAFIDRRVGPSVSANFRQVRAAVEAKIAKRAKEGSRVRAAVDAIAAADPSHGVAQARAILWAADSETRIADVAARVLAEGGGPAEIAREIVAIGGRVAP